MKRLLVGLATGLVLAGLTLAVGEAWLQHSRPPHPHHPTMRGFALLIAAWVAFSVGAVLGIWVIGPWLGRRAARARARMLADLEAGRITRL